MGTRIISIRPALPPALGPEPSSYGSSSSSSQSFAAFDEEMQWAPTSSSLITDEMFASPPLVSVPFVEGQGASSAVHGRAPGVRRVRRGSDSSLNIVPYCSSRHQSSPESPVDKSPLSTVGAAAPTDNQAAYFSHLSDLFESTAPRTVALSSVEKNESLSASAFVSTSCSRQTLTFACAGEELLRKCCVIV